LLSLAAELIFEIDNHIDIELRGEKNVSARGLEKVAKTHSIYYTKIKKTCKSSLLHKYDHNYYKIIHIGLNKLTLQCNADPCQSLA